MEPATRVRGASASVVTSLFDYVLVVDIVVGMTYLIKISSRNHGGKKPDTTVVYRFPAAATDAKAKEKESPFVTSVLGFCFPDISHMQPVTQFKGDTFSFILTDMTGNRRFGYCARSLSSGNTPRYPRAFCILSYIPCYELFQQILGIVDVRLVVSPDACDAFLSAVRAQPLPRPGDSLHLQVTSAHTQRLETYKLTRPADSDRYLDVLNLDVVVRHVNPANLLELFSCLIRERRIVFLSSNVAVLSDCVQAILGLLYPFSWQYVLIPVLPTPLLNFCCAPMPFVVGVMSADHPELEKMKSAMEEVVLFDLDRDQFTWKPFNDVECIPKDLRDQLLAGVKKASPYHNSIFSAFKDKQQIKNAPPPRNLKAINHAIADEFLAFFVQSLKDYSFFLIGLPGAETWVFARDSFCENAKDPIRRRFLEEITSTQMFEQFIRERELNRDRYLGAFEQNVRMLNSLSKAKLSATNDKEREMIDTAIQGVTKQQPGFLSKIKNAFQ